MVDATSLGGLSQTNNSTKLRGIIKLRNDKARMAVGNAHQSSFELNSVSKLVNTLNPRALNQGLQRVASISRGDTKDGMDIMPRTAESPTRLAPR